MIATFDKIIDSEGNIRPNIDAVYWQKVSETETTMTIEIFS